MYAHQVLVIDIFLNLVIMISTNGNMHIMCILCIYYLINLLILLFLLFFVICREGRGRSFWLRRVAVGLFSY